MSDIHASAEVMRESAVAVMRALGMEPDPWQIDAMAGRHKQLLLNCCRQAKGVNSSTTIFLSRIYEECHQFPYDGKCPTAANGKVDSSGGHSA